MYKCFGVDYPVSSDKLSELISKVVGNQVGVVKLWDWDEVVRELECVYELS